MTFCNISQFQVSASLTGLKSPSWSHQQMGMESPPSHMRGAHLPRAEFDSLFRPEGKVSGHAQAWLTGWRAGADTRWPVIFTTVMVTSRKASDPIFKIHNSFGHFTVHRALSHCYLHDHPTRQAEGHPEPHVTVGNLRLQGPGPSKVSSAQIHITNHHLELGAALPLAPSLLLCRAH